MVASSPRHTRNYEIENELSESRLRKLEVENSSLKSENKSLKDKYHRAQGQPLPYPLVRGVGSGQLSSGF